MEDGRAGEGLTRAQGLSFAKGPGQQQPPGQLTRHVHWVQGSSSRVNTWPFPTFLPSKLQSAGAEERP